MGNIIEKVSGMFGIPIEEVKKDVRTGNGIKARMVICGFLYNEKKMTHLEISKLFDRDTHQLSLRSYNKFIEELKNGNAEISNAYSELLKSESLKKKKEISLLNVTSIMSMYCGAEGLEISHDKIIQMATTFTNKNIVTRFENQEQLISESIKFLTSKLK